MSEAIKNLVRSTGWKKIEEMFEKEISTLKDPSDIPNNIRNDIYAREVRSRVMAAKTLQNFMRKIQLSGSDAQSNKKISYK